jgi:creatinine amidohydrolase
MNSGRFSHLMSETEPTDEYRYWKLTWPQVDAAVEAGKTVVIPVGSTEDHGHHLPLDVDQVLPGTICETAVRERDDTLLFQTIPHGYLPHHMDYPGGITIRWDTFVNYLIDVGVSLCHHGFERLLFVNGHGSNHHLVEQATRQVNLQYPGARAAMISWWEIAELREAAADLRDAGPEGTSHAGELETSLYLHIDPDGVDMDLAERDVTHHESPYFHNDDLAGGTGPEDSTSATMMPWWSTVSETGVRGDPSVATAEKGEAFLEAAVEGLNALLDGFVDYPLREMEDKHVRDVDDRAYDPFRPR